MTDSLLLPVLIFAAAVLYSAVGHGGASGYLAAMALIGVAPEAMRPIALILNVPVASIAVIRFARAGNFVWATFWPFVVTSMPAAFLGGWLNLPTAVFKPVVGAILLIAAIDLFHSAGRAASGEAGQSVRPVPPAAGIAIGAGIGLLSGLTGTGGGVFLSPILLFAAWVTMRGSAGVAAAFILCNSIAGLAGTTLASGGLPDGLPVLIAVAGLGGLIGSHIGARLLPVVLLRRVLALLLVIAGFKLIAF
ncbi:MAG: sulfite exporter TauE/SafE family protein [Alphaproteobacteria bacterium]|nr:sulfite exporter TauE/SafE family protein [Alphaproteobacteria bacterium]